MNKTLTHRITVLLFALTIFVSAFLLFQVQPIMGKYILPWYGGSPGVWTTCMLVFQVLLFGGYAYAHLLNRFLTLRMQIALHCSLLLLATTNQVCLDTGVIPFLWVIPLAIYLLTFILTFDSDRWYSRRPCIMLAAISFLVLFALKLIEYRTPLTIDLALYFGGLFFSCMVCHGELVRLKPHPTKLTSFYMTIVRRWRFGRSICRSSSSGTVPKIFRMAARPFCLRFGFS